MRKKIYQVLQSMRYGDIVSVLTCRVDGQSSRVRTEIYELRHTYGIRIITVKGVVGRCAAYFLEDSEKNIEKVDFLLKKYEKKKVLASHQKSVKFHSTA